MVVMKMSRMRHSYRDYLVRNAAGKSVWILVALVGIIILILAL